MCLFSKLIRNKKYLPNKKNGGNPPSIHDKRTTFVPIGCGNCIECRKQKAREWQVRLLEDIKSNKNGKFITLTFSNESIKKLISENEILQKLKGYALDNQIAIIALKLFRERHRKKFGKSIRHWLITELGHNGTENIHLHGIIWTNIPLTEIEKIWQYGFMWKGKGDKQINYVSAITISYMIKYVHKIDEQHKYYKPIILTSPGIGSNYTKSHNIKLNKFKGTETKETYKTSTGHEISLPIYWRNKIYNEEEREKLWIQKLDKDERWICGEKVKNSDTDEYWKLIHWHRKRNAKLGYGSSLINNEDKEYEENRRILMYETRIKNANKNICTTGKT